MSRAVNIRIAGRRRLTAREWGGREPGVVLLHGLLDSAAGWEALALASGQRCLAVDLPGFGGSPLPARPRIDAYADDVAEALAARGAERFVLVGHSLGGAVATAVAERLPDRVAALVLLAPCGFGRIPLAEAATLPGVFSVVQRALPLALGNPVLVAAAYATLVTRYATPDPRLVARVMTSAMTAAPGARDAALAIAAAGLDGDGFHRRRVAYDGPVQAVWGSHDHLVPLAHAGALATSLPQARIEVWRGMGHHAQRERPRRLAGVLARACAQATIAPQAPRRAPLAA
jgi:pimeloyl-ACP methyl ester carboxylesterase